MEAIDYSLLYHCTGKDLTFGKLFLCKILRYFKVYRSEIQTCFFLLLVHSYMSCVPFLFYSLMFYCFLGK